MLEVGLALVGTVAIGIALYREMNRPSPLYNAALTSFFMFSFAIMSIFTVGLLLRHLFFMPPPPLTTQP